LPPQSEPAAAARRWLRRAGSALQLGAEQVLHLAAQVGHLLRQRLVGAPVRVRRRRGVCRRGSGGVAGTEGVLELLREAVVGSQSALVVAPLRLEHGGLRAGRPTQTKK
jgi:hypothetical protein